MSNFEKITETTGAEGQLSGIINDFNVYLNGKGPDGILFRNVKKVILPKTSAYENGREEPADMKLVFGGCEEAAEIIKLMGKKCKLEIRAAATSLEKSGKAELHGHRHILEAVPMELELSPLERMAAMAVTIGLRVFHYTATVGDTELWDFEWTEQG